MDQYMIQNAHSQSKENVWRSLYVLALELALASYLTKSLYVPSYYSVFHQSYSQEVELKEIIKFLDKNKITCIWNITNKDMVMIENENEGIFHSGLKKNKKIPLVNWSLLVQIANAYRSLSNKLLYKWRQLENYDQWVPKEFLQTMLERSIQLLENLYSDKIISNLKNNSKLFQFYSKLSHPIHFKQNQEQQQQQQQQQEQQNKKKRRRNKRLFLLIYIFIYMNKPIWKQMMHLFI